MTAASVVRLVDIRETPLRVEEVLEQLADVSAGGLTLFVGTVRDHDGGKQVGGLEYSAHPTALERLRTLMVEHILAMTEGEYSAVLLADIEIASTFGPFAGSTGAEPGVVPIPTIGWVHKTDDPRVTVIMLYVEGLRDAAAFAAAARPKLRRTARVVGPGNPYLSTRSCDAAQR